MALKDTKIIYEQAMPSEVQILEESASAGGAYRIKFKARLQEADVLNNNRRLYPAETLEEVYNQLKPKAQSRQLIGEMDHPQPQGDSAAKIKRSSTISLERACFLITDLEWDGQAIYGICETLTNRFGMDLYCLLKDGVTVGFSLRAFGETKQENGVTKVLPRGLKALTYDCVANPSHSSSVITEMITESDSEQDILQALRQEVLLESSSLNSDDNKNLLEENSLDPLTAQISESLPKKICLGNVCTVAPLEEAVEYLVEQVVHNNKIPNVKIKAL